MILIIAKMLRLAEYTQTAGVPTFSQFAGAEAISNKEKESESLLTFMKELLKAGVATVYGACFG